MAELQKLRTYNYKAGNGIYVSEMWKVNKGIYNYETVLDKKTIAQGKNLGIKTALKLESHIREVIKNYEKTGETVSEEMEIEEAKDEVEMQDAIDELNGDDEEEVVEEVDEDEDWEEDEEDVEDEEEALEEENDEKELQAEFEKETGKSALTTRGTLRKDYTKWKESQ